MATTKDIFARLIGANGLLSKPRRSKKEADLEAYEIRNWLYSHREGLLTLFTMLYDDDMEVSRTGSLMKDLAESRKEVGRLATRNAALRRNRNVNREEMVGTLMKKIEDLHFRIEVLQQFRDHRFTSPSPEDMVRAMEDVEKARKINEKGK